MSAIKHLQREEFNEIMQQGNDLILFFYKKNDATSILGLNTMKEVYQLIGRTFEMYLVDVEAEPDIAKAFSIEIVPEYISMRKTKISKRCTDLLEPSKVLDLLK